MNENNIKVKIVKHEDGTYSLSHLTGKELNIISSALVHNWLSLETQKRKDGRLNAFATESLTFSNVVSDQIINALYR